MLAIWLIIHAEAWTKYSNAWLINCSSVIFFWDEITCPCSNNSQLKLLKNRYTYICVYIDTPITVWRTFCFLFFYLLNTMDGPPTRFSLISLCTCAWSSPKVWNRPGKSLMANFSASPGSVGASVMRSNPKSLMTRACLSKASRKGPTSRLLYLSSQSRIDFIPSLCQIRCNAA